MRIGLELRAKPNKTEAEQQLADSFFKSTVLSFIVILPLGILLIIITVYCMNNFLNSSANYYEGHVAEDRTIWYIQNTKHTLNAEDIGLRTNDLIPGDTVYIIHDNNGNITSITDEMPGNNYLIFMVLAYIICCTIIIAFCFWLSRSKSTKAWNDWLKNNKI